MAEIEVVFPKSGRPFVYHPSTPVLKGEPIFWHIHTDNRHVKQIRIAFHPANGNPAPCFFSTDQGKHSEITKPLSGRDFIYGRSPHPPGHNNKPVRDKYTVYGLDDQGRRVPGAFLDPTIISEDP